MAHESKNVHLSACRSRGLRSAAILALAGLTVSALAACGSGGDAASANEPWKIGIVTSFTGPANALGLDEINSYRLAAELVNAEGGINGRKVKIVEDDDQSQPQQAVTVINKQIFKDGVVGIVGGLSTGATLAVKPIIEKAKTPLEVAAVGIDVTAGDPKYVFRSTVSDRVSNSWIVGYLQENKLKRLALIYDSNAYGTGSAEMTKKIIKEKSADVDVVAEKTFATADTDMRAQLTAIAAAKPDAVYVIGTNPGPALVIKQAHELGLNATIVGSTGILSDKTIEIAGKDAADGLVVPGLGSKDHVRPEQRPFVDAFVKKYNREPKGFEWLGDGMYLMLEALKHVKAGPDDLNTAREQLRDSIEQNTKDITWSSGPFTYSAENHEGADERTIVPMTVSNGAFVPIAK
jgi:branched-chain amino acid transport system substrate-binding protein